MDHRLWFKLSRLMCYLLYKLKQTKIQPLIEFIQPMPTFKKNMYKKVRKNVGID